MKNFYSCGVDIGSRTIKIVILSSSGDIVDFSINNTGASPAENASLHFSALCVKNNIDKSKIMSITATGYGRNYFTEATKTSSEIICHAAGVHKLLPDVRTIIDIGGQDSKIMSISDSGKVLHFVMNDRCAAGTGKFIEMVSRTMDLPLADMARLSIESEEYCEISSMCAVFAESEIIGLLHKGQSPGSIVKGVFRSIAKRLFGMASQVGLNSPVAFTGGVALNNGVKKAVESLLHQNVLVPNNPQITGALGAAFLGLDQKK